MISKLKSFFAIARLYTVERRRWRHISKGKPGIFYGYEKIASTDETASGGAVKLQDLIRAFPNELAAPNMLYLISSALPPFCDVMADFARKAGARLVLNQNGVAYPAWSPTGWEEQNRPMKKILGMADYVFYQSEFCRISADRFLGRFGGPSKILYNPVDTKVFVPAAKLTLGDPVTLLLAGSHGHYYRVRCAVETVAVLKRLRVNARLIIAGRYCWQDNEAIALQESKELARNMGVESQVVFSGSYTQRDAVSLLHKADILLHTKYNDPCPRLVAEAMSCGLPVVYSASGGVPELVGEEGGVGVGAPLDWEKDHPPSPEALADCVQSIVSDYKCFAQGARKRAVDRFDVLPWLERHREVFESLCR